MMMMMIIIIIIIIIIPPALTAKNKISHRQLMSVAREHIPFVMLSAGEG